MAGVTYRVKHPGRNRGGKVADKVLKVLINAFKVLFFSKYRWCSFLSVEMNQDCDTNRDHLWSNDLLLLEACSGTWIFQMCLDTADPGQSQPQQKVSDGAVSSCQHLKYCDSKPQDKSASHE